MAGEGKSTILIAIISAISAVVVAVVTTYGTIAVSQPEAKRVKKELQEISDLQLIANLPVGTIVASMLEPGLFSEAVGDPSVFDPEKSKWVLADAQENITRSRYGRLLNNKTHTPDLRGVFLRGMNVKGGKDPQQNRTAGDYQPDAFAEHNHKLFFHYRSFKGEGGRGRPAIDAATSAKYDTPMEGADETRPKNVAVYFYIKIN